RVPDTLNNNHGQPIMATLDEAESSFVQYSMQDLSQALAQYIVKGSKKTGSGPSKTTSDWAASFISDTEKLPPVPIDDVAINCPMVAATLASGGEGKSEPEWNNDIYLSAWTSDPKDAAHKLSQGYADYDEAEVSRKLSEKQTAIGANNLGWPLWAPFNSPQCQSCPMFQLGKSPLHFVPRTAQAEPVQPKPEADDLFPEGYWRNVHDHVFTNGRFGPFDVFSGYPVHNGWVDSETGELVLLTSIGGSERYGNINVSKQASGPMCEALTRGTKNGIIIHNNQKDVKDCVMAWMTHLQTRKRTIHPQ